MSNPTPTEMPAPVAVPRATASVNPSNLSRGMRETIEAVAIAFALAFLFKTFEAEAFVIPTGSMAPTLMGRHKDVVCPQCGFRYSASASDEADRNGRLKPGNSSQVVGCTCPNCRFPMSVDPFDATGRDNPSYSGDRIWVSKVPYQIMEPKRWDVIVFRYPEEAETYYIKRLVGLPNEVVKIFHGDIYAKGADDKDFVIQRKSPEKLRAMMQTVYDNDYVSPQMLASDWPLRWQPWSQQDSEGDWTPSEDARVYSTTGQQAGETWMRYQHIVPPESNWHLGEWNTAHAPQAQLISDFYAFNARVLRSNPQSPPSVAGLHWVGDLILECELDVQNDSGQVLVDLVKGGRHFGASIDVKTGKATLSIDGLEGWQPTGQTAIQGPGKHTLRFANVDRELTLWVDDSVISFDVPTAYDDLGNDRPQSSSSDLGDLAPVGIGSRGAALTASHLRVLRDIYYIAEKGPYTEVVNDYEGADSYAPWRTSERVLEFLATPAKWQAGGDYFDRRQEVTFPLAEDQFFVLGDNSPASSDARLWSKQHFVERELLVGKALFVYWPHPLDLHIPFTDFSIGVMPNLSGMGFIR